ncbi:GntR family transcriptional regulator [Streptomyces sp. NPDC047017]|uniref:GntR family transcriptional regulator n=1 Tax=Streptomyces sp. NPDC047017 TaxID=3155024 RepID=UPI0033E7596E
MTTPATAQPGTVPPGPIPRAEPLRESVYARIVELVATGHFAPGAALTEASLSRALGVSRTPVREALLRLQAEGVVDSALARGFVVRPITTRECGELYPVLGTLEALALRSVAHPPADAVVERLTGCLRELERCEDPVRRRGLDTRYHEALVGLCGNGRLAALTGQLRNSLSRYEIAYMHHAPERAHADTEHREILAALTAGDGELAATLTQRHWASGMQVVMTWLAGTDGTTATTATTATTGTDERTGE